MKNDTFTFKAADGTQIFTYRWMPDDASAIVGAVQIAHGMVEHAARYERFAAALTKAGYAVYANDHRGHGKTAGSLDRVGYFDDEMVRQLVREVQVEAVVHRASEIRIAIGYIARPQPGGRFRDIAGIAYQRIVRREGVGDSSLRNAIRQRQRGLRAVESGVGGLNESEVLVAAIRRALQDQLRRDHVTGETKAQSAFVA